MIEHDSRPGDVIEVDLTGVGPWRTATFHDWVYGLGGARIGVRVTLDSDKVFMFTADQCRRLTPAIPTTMPVDVSTDHHGEIVVRLRHPDPKVADDIWRLPRPVAGALLRGLADQIGSQFK